MSNRIEGDLLVGRNIYAGGDLNIPGNAIIKRDIKIDGWLIAPNVKTFDLGLYKSDVRLKQAHPNAPEGSFALVGDTLPADVWRVENGRWVATGGKSSDLSVDLTTYAKQEEVTTLGTEVGCFPFSNKDYEGDLANFLVEGYWDDNKEIHNDSDFRTIKYLLSGDYYLEILDDSGNAISIGYRAYDENGIAKRLGGYKIDISQYYLVGVVFPYTQELYTYRIRITQKRATKTDITDIENNIADVVYNDKLYSYKATPITSSMIADNMYWHDDLTLYENEKFAALKRTINLKPGYNVRVKDSDGNYVSMRIRYKDVDGNISFDLTDSFSSVNGCVVGLYCNKSSEADLTKGGTIEITQSSFNENKTIICCWGSSSVEGYLGNTLKYLGVGAYSEVADDSMSFPKMLASLVDSEKFEVWNCGIGGEGTPTILARMGAIPMYNDTEFVLPADGSFVDIARYDKNTFLKSIFDDSIVVPNEAYSGADTYDARSVLNPVYVNGIECTLDLYSPTGDAIVNNSGNGVFTNGAFRLKRNKVATTDVTIPVGTVFTPNAAKLFQSKNVIHIYLIGANGGWYNWEDFKNKMNKCIDWFGNKYLVLGYHTPSIFTGYSDDQLNQFNIDLPSVNDFRELQKKEYGLKFLDLRYMMAKRWFADFAEKFGLKIYYVSRNGTGTFNGNIYVADDISVIPNEYHKYLEEMPIEWKNYNLPSDIQCFNLEMPPTCLMADGTSRTYSGQHCNFDGYKVMGSYVFEKLQELGWV